MQTGIPYRAGQTARPRPVSGVALLVYLLGQSPLCVELQVLCRAWDRPKAGRRGRDIREKEIPLLARGSKPLQSYIGRCGFDGET